MNKIFLAYSYRDENKRLIADVVDPLVRSHNLLPVAGDILGGEQLTAAVQGLIASSDALVGFMTRDRPLAGGNSFTATQWVQNELLTARNRPQKAIAVVESGVDTSGMFSESERIDFDRANPLPAVVKLSQTIALWKAEAGRAIEIKILPDAAAKVAVNDQMKCEYRLIPPLGRPGSWVEAYASRKPGGVFLLLQGVKPDEAIEVKISKKGNNGTARWASSQYPQWVHIALEKAP